MKVLGVAYDGRDLGELAAAAYSMGLDFEIALTGRSISESEKASSYGTRVYIIDSMSPETIYRALRRLVESEDFKIIIGIGHRNLRDALSRLAGAINANMTTDAIGLELQGGSGVLVERGFLSEKAMMKALLPLPAIVLFIPRFAEPASPKGYEGRIVKLDLEEGAERVLERRSKTVGAANLEDAEVIVGVGRGFKAREDLNMAFELARLLGGQVGCTRPIAADLKWLPEDHWIGISGKRVAPKLYLAVGISGSPQHMSGVQNAKIIVAVNKDKSAPIFKQADYGVVADLYQFLPILIDKLKSRLGGSG